MRVADLRVGDHVFVWVDTRERQGCIVKIDEAPTTGRVRKVHVQLFRGPRLRLHPSAVLRRVSRRFSSDRGSPRADAQAGRDD